MRIKDEKVRTSVPYGRRNRVGEVERGLGLQFLVNV